MLSILPVWAGAIPLAVYCIKDLYLIAGVVVYSLSAISLTLLVLALYTQHPEWEHEGLLKSRCRD